MAKFMGPSTRRFGRSILLTLAVVALAWSQSTRTVHGVVTDRHGNLLAHAAVQIKDTRTLLIRSFVTQDDGKFHFANLNRDIDYELSALYDGVRTHAHTLSKFDSSDDPEVTLRVPLGE